MTDRLAVVQIDSVNVLSRSHYLPAFSRLGAYPRAALDELASRRRHLFEYWAHEASYLPVRLQPQPALAHGRGRAARLGQHGAAAAGAARATSPRCSTASATTVRSRPASSPSPKPHRPGTMWNWHAGKVALEWLFFTGALTARTRTTGFERVYDLTERVLPREIVDAPTPDRRTPSANWSGRRPGRSAWPPSGTCATTSGCPSPPPGRRSPSWPTPVSSCRSRSPAGAARRGCDPDARRPRWIRARALLSPFDSLVWERPRVERIFGFRYRLEIYTPAAKRVHGYYVLPFLLGDQLVARVDLKADRQAGVLRVQAAHAEDGVDRPLVAAALADELRLMADWLELDDVDVLDRGRPGPPTWRGTPRRGAGGSARLIQPTGGRWRSRWMRMSPETERIVSVSCGGPSPSAPSSASWEFIRPGRWRGPARPAGRGDADRGRRRTTVFDLDRSDPSRRRSVTSPDAGWPVRSCRQVLDGDVAGGGAQLESSGRGRPTWTSPDAEAAMSAPVHGADPGRPARACAGARRSPCRR